MAENVVLKLDNVSKSFAKVEKDEITHALGNINLEMRSGEFISLVGTSGCGKSTILRLIAGLITPTMGRLTVNDQEITGPDPERGMVFQRPTLFPWLTVEKNIAFSLKMQNKLKGNEDKVERMLRLIGLEDFKDDYPGQLSGGMAQRVALVRSLINEPPILLLDEPLGALDLKLRKEMQLELKRLQREMNITFVYVTHDQEEALTMSDTVVVMSGGKIQQIGSPQDIYNEPKNAFVARFIGDSNIVDGVMLRDFYVNFGGHDFTCVDRGFKPNEPVQVVIRPEDVQIVPPSVGMLTGLVREVIFKGVHFEMHVDVEGYEWIIHSTQASQPGELIGMNIGPDEIHIMKRSEV